MAPRLVREDDNRWIPQVFYGEIQEILVCELPDRRAFGDLAGKTRLLAVIQPCSTAGRDACNEVVCYTQKTQPIVQDIRTIVAVVGRVPTRGEWGIVDRSGGLLHPSFVTV
ncbi:hypothetical protein R3P38DRAFT_2575789 [Favolaschia claudopus]|uniref:Uncharacterized protein n=1 Tax=Favolaschia claudopus TaxID=2862362 RepID=A0AAV9ZK57_9AGAR